MKINKQKILKRLYIYTLLCIPWATALILSIILNGGVDLIVNNWEMLTGASFLIWFFWVNNILYKNDEAHVVISNVFFNHQDGIKGLQKDIKGQARRIKNLEKDGTDLNNSIKDIINDIKSFEKDYVKDDKTSTKLRIALKKKKDLLKIKRQEWKIKQIEIKAKLRENTKQEKKDNM